MKAIRSLWIIIAVLLLAPVSARAYTPQVIISSSCSAQANPTGAWGCYDAVLNELFVWNGSSAFTVVGGGSGTVTSIGTGNGLTGGPITSSGTVSLPTATAAQLLLENAGATGFAAVSLSGDCTVVSTGAITCLSTSGTAFTSAATGNVAGLTTGTLAPARGGLGVGTFPSANYAPFLQSSGAGVGPGGGGDMRCEVIYQPTPFQFTNTDIGYYPSTADATAENDFCFYSYSGTTLTLIADTGLIAIAGTTGIDLSALGGGTSNLATQPTATTCGSSGSGFCAVGIWTPGYYAQCFGSGATTGKIHSAQTSSQSFYSNTSITGATGGECPATVTTISLAPTTGSPLVIFPW